MATTLRLHAFLPRSRANGPGVRAVVWVQGCTLGCPACFNPGTHDPAGGEAVLVEELAERIGGLSDLDGLTLSGGEPLQQLPAVVELLRLVRAGRRTTSRPSPLSARGEGESGRIASVLSVVLFTGYTLSAAAALPGTDALWPLVDAVIAGPYVASLGPPQGLLGSSNQQLHLLTDRYRPADFADLPTSEVIITPDGSTVVTGLAAWRPRP